jgi:hypothetical protein
MLLNLSICLGILAVVIALSWKARSGAMVLDDTLVFNAVRYDLPGMPYRPRKTLEVELHYWRSGTRRPVFLTYERDARLHGKEPAEPQGGLDKLRKMFIGADYVSGYRDLEPEALPRALSQVFSGQFGWRLTGWATHAICGMLVYAILSYFFPVTPALLGALVFVCHPKASYIPNYIAARPSGMCAAFYFAGLVCALAGVWWLSIPFAYLAYKSKEEGLAFPFAAVATWWLG